MSEQAKITTLADYKGNMVAPRTTAEAVAYGDKTVDGALNGHLGDTVSHITAAERTKWDAKGNGDMLKSVYDANGDGIVDNAAMVNGLTVQTAVPANAKFTDTVYTHPASHPASMITGLVAVATSGKYTDLSGTPTSLPANGGTSAACSGNATTATTATNSNACNGLTFAVSQTAPGVVNNRVTFVWG